MTVPPLLLLLVLLLAGVTGCAGASHPGRARPSASAGSGAGSAGQPQSDTLPAGLLPISGDGFRFGLPAEPAFTGPQRKVQDSGTVLQAWTHHLGPAAADPYCFVSIAVQPRYDGDFPGLAIAYFANPAPEGKRVLVNQVLKPTPPGASAAVVQQSLAPARLGDGRIIQVRTFQRQYLGTDRTLVTINSSAPQTAVTSCHSEQIAASLQLARTTNA